MAPDQGSPELQRWNDRFQRDDYLFGTEPNAFLAAQRQHLRPGMHALCVADGEGRNSVWLAAQGLQVSAFDFSPVAVDKARTLAAQRGVCVDHQVRSLADWQWQPDHYDLVAAIFVQFAPPAERERMFEGFILTLRPGGLLLLEGYRPEQLVYATGGPPQASHLYTEELLRKAFAPLEILHLAAYDAAVAEGSGHHGMSALIDLVARKPTN